MSALPQLVVVFGFRVQRYDYFFGFGVFLDEIKSSFYYFALIYRSTKSKRSKSKQAIITTLDNKKFKQTLNYANFLKSPHTILVFSIQTTYICSTKYKFAELKTSNQLKMKKIAIFIIFLAIISISETITAQQADHRINELISQGDWATLDAEFPLLRDEVHIITRHRAEAIIGYHFNQPEKALHAIEWLLENSEFEHPAWREFFIQSKKNILGIGRWQILNRTVEISSQGDWFTLRDEFPTWQDEQSEMMRHFSEAMIGLNFNQPEKTIQSLDWLIENIPTIFWEDFNNMFGWQNGFAITRSHIIAMQGKYAESVDSLSVFLARFAPFRVCGDYFGNEQFVALFESLRNETKPQITRPDRDIEIPLTIKDVDEGQLMYILVKVNDKEYNFVLSSGSNGIFLTEHLANEMGVRTVKDSIVMHSNFRTEIGKMGLLDSLMIGDIVFKNPLIAIGLPNEETDTIFRPDAIIGVDFMRMMGEVRIFPHENRIVFPMQKTELPSFGSNLMLLNFLSPYLKTYSNGERVVFLLSTGSRRTDLEHFYYARHREKLGEIGERRVVSRGLDSFYAYQLPTLSLTVGDTDVVLTDIDVLLNEEVAFNPNEHGVLGMEFFTSFRKIIINFVDMFVKVEK